MSNKVGELYNTVIETVIKDTKTEFEDTGDDPAVLDMLMKAWRKRLGEMNVIKDPGWDAEARKDDSLSLGQPGSMSAAVQPQMPPVPSAVATENMSMGSDGLLFGLPPVKQDPTDVSLGSAGSQIPGQGYSRGANVGPNSTQSPLSQHPLYVKDESFDMLVPPPERSSAAFNPLNSNKLDHDKQVAAGPVTLPNGAQLPRGASLSPELQKQLQDAMARQSKVPQTDGPQDEELNSDLDDSEDELLDSNDDEEGEQTQIMLCLYEKVHKVKTRWKYTLKDGVANVNGLDYVFARANGESEW